MTRPTYQYLSDDEKTAIAEATIRNVEYQMYQAELQLLAEKAKNTPDEARVAYLEEDIKDKQNQIAAINL
jgi:DnaJ-domain-containing protein 1